MRKWWWIGLAFGAVFSAHADHSALPFTPGAPERSYSESSRELKDALPGKRSELQASIDRLLTQIANNTRQGFPFPDAGIENTLQLIRAQLGSGQRVSLNKNSLAPEEESVLLDNIDMLVEYSRQVLLSQLKNPSNSDEMNKANGAETLRRQRGRAKPRWLVRDRQSGSKVLNAEASRREELFERGSSQAFLDFSEYLQSQWKAPQPVRPVREVLPASQSQVPPETSSEKESGDDDIAADEADMLLTRSALEEQREDALTNSEEFFETNKDEVEAIAKDAEQRLIRPMAPVKDTPALNDSTAADPEVR